MDPAESSFPPPLPPPPPLPEQYGLWSPGMTLVWGLVISFIYFVSQSILLVIYAISVGEEMSEEALEALVYQGDCLALLTISSAVTMIPVMLAVVWLKRGKSFSAYFGLSIPKRRVWMKWMLALVAVLIAMDLLTMALGRDVVTDFMPKAIRSSSVPVFLILAIVVAAPLWEEFFFRGFLLVGWQHSWMKAPGAIVVTSLLFAVIHTQYDLYTMSQVFFVGILLGWARHKTGSLWVPIGMHAAMNTVATVQTYLHMM